MKLLLKFEVEARSAFRLTTMSLFSSCQRALVSLFGPLAAVQPYGDAKLRDLGRFLTRARNTATRASHDDSGDADVQHTADANDSDNDDGN